MTIESDEEYQRACAEYELLKDETGKDYRKQELVEALYKYEERFIEPEDIRDARENWEQGINSELRSNL